jgi:hypothetical protein
MHVASGCTVKDNNVAAFDVDRLLLRWPTQLLRCSLLLLLLLLLLQLLVLLLRSLAPAMEAP